VPVIGVYWQFVRMGFRRESRYLSAALAGLVANVVFGLIKAAVLLGAAQAAGGTVAGYTTGMLSAYVWLSQGMLGAVTLSGSAEIGERIRTGDIAVDLARPVDVQLAHLATDLGRATFTFVPRGLPSVAIGLLFVGMTMPTTVLPYVLGVVSLYLGITLSFLCRFAVNLVGFWTIETRGVQNLYMVASSFLSGLFVPVPIFPDWLQAIALSTPFPSIMMTPIDILSGRIGGLDAVAAMAVQVGWVLLIGLAGHLLLVAGQRKLEVQGG